MSTYKAIAGVSNTLKNLLRDRLTETATVTLAPPDVTVDTVSGARLNLYLYELTENAFLKNQEIPGSGHPASYGRPPLSLDLHYLFTAFGSSETGVDADVEAQRILGDGMRVLHDIPIITSDLKQEKQPGKPLVLDPTLVSEFERVKITLKKVSLDEFSKIWVALPKTNFRRSVAYIVSVVQIESLRQRESPLPVREPRVYVFPFRTPQITGIELFPPVPGLSGAIASTGDTLRITGFNLKAPFTSVKLDSDRFPIAAPQDALIDFVVPGSVTAGIHALQVVHDLKIVTVEGQPPVQRGGFESNAVPVMIIPKLSAPTLAGGVITVTVDPAVGLTQQVSLLLDDFVLPASLPPAPGPPTTTVQFRLPVPPDPVVPSGPHLIRIRVDGAESRLTFNTTTKVYDNPTFTLP